MTQRENWQRISTCFTHSINTAVDTGGHITMLSFWLQSSRECSTTWQSNFQHHRECMLCNESVSGVICSRLVNYWRDLRCVNDLCESLMPGKLFVQTFKSLLAEQWKRHVYWNQSRHPVHLRIFKLSHMSSRDTDFFGGALTGLRATGLKSWLNLDCNFKSLCSNVDSMEIPVCSLIHPLKLESFVNTALFVTSQSPFLVRDDEVMPSKNHKPPCCT